MRVMVLGANGMLGHQLCKVLGSRLDLWGTVRGDPLSYERYRILPRERLISDITVQDLGKLEQSIDQVRPNAIVNAIGIIKQRDEARQAIPSIQVNSLFPHQLAEICSRLDIRLIHISTDCVFSGFRGHYSEVDLPDPVDLYGRTKLMGELNRSGCLTLRTSIIGWELSGRSSLLEWFACQRGRRIKGYQKAIYSGFSSSIIANLIGDLIETRPDLKGLYQVASKPISKYDLLVGLQQRLKWTDIQIDPDTMFHCDRSLMGSRFEIETGWQAPEWDAILDGLAHEWPNYAEWRTEAQ